MDLDLLDFIYDGYTQYCSNCRISETVKEVEEFDEKYIKPLLKQNPKAGLEMEGIFNLALAQYGVQSFKDGFRACMHFMMECFKSDL